MRNPTPRGGHWALAAGGALALAALLWGFSGSRAPAGKAPMTDPVVKTDAEWRALLTPEQYRVTRQGGTECAFTGELYAHKGDGVYDCICCGQPLFRSDDKFESGTGWPSFFRPVAADALEEREDRSHGMRRIEVRCRRCDAHLGHVFPDGPPPTNLRFCINSIALRFRPDEAAGQP